MTPRARTYVALAGLLVLGLVFVRAGLWQWQRAADSETMRVQFATGTDAVRLATLPRALTDAERFRRIEIRGEYVVEPQFLLDNMLHDGQAGYHVLTALRVVGRREHVLVNRGWVAAGPDRAVLPRVAVPGGVRTVTGRLERLPRPAMRLGGASVGAPVGAVAVVQFPTAAELADALAEPVFDYQVLLDAPEPDGFVREWQAPGLPPERHLSYAGQWWLFATGVLVAAVVLTVRNVRRRS